jgi:hypothetical protein
MLFLSHSFNCSHVGFDRERELKLSSLSGLSDVIFMNSLTKIRHLVSIVTWYAPLKEEHRLRVFENRVLM